MRTDGKGSDQTKHENFFKRHPKLLGILGTVIVFSTFITKDALRESVKDRKDTLAAARTTDLIRTDSHEVESNLEVVALNVVSFESNFRAIQEHEPDPYKDHQGTYSDLDRNVASVSPSFDRANWSLERANGLAAQLPISDEQRKSLKAADTELAEVKSQLDSLNDLLSRKHNTERGIIDDQMPTDDFAKEFEPAVRKSLDVTESAIKLTKESNELSSKILQAAEEDSAQLETKYRRYTWVSYGLYTFGSILAMAGRFFGADDAVPES